MDSLNIALPARSDPLVLPWPIPGNPSGFIQFEHGDQWREFIRSLDVNPSVPEIVRLKYARAQKLYLLGWLDADLIKAGELVALTALELATRNCYGRKIHESLENKKSLRPSKARKSVKPVDVKFADLLNHMVTADGLSDDQMPMVARYGGSVVGQLIGTTKPTLAERRNAMAHGDPFDGLPIGGLLELVRDLIAFAYRHNT